jgi:hypothetical protein
MHPPHSEDWHAIALLCLGGLVYGACWLIPAMLLSDLVFLRRPLSMRGTATYVGVIAGSAAIIGITIPGYLVMVGVPSRSWPLASCVAPEAALIPVSA